MVTIQRTGLQKMRCCVKKTCQTEKLSTMTTYIKCCLFSSIKPLETSLALHAFYIEPRHEKT